jgi:UDP-2,3-diacylglucosamine hydrolase
MEPVRAVFLSDAHLGLPEDPHYQHTLAFLKGLEGVSDLFLLGDVFAYWMGFSRPPARYAPLIERLAALHEGGVRLHYVEGNHDMDVGRYFTKHLGADVHPERMEITLCGRRLLLMHGDTVDRNDRGYRFLRAFLRSLPMKALTRVLAPETVLKVADRYTLHKAGRVYAASHLPALMERYARDRWEEGYDGVVMGHCHAPAFVTDTRDGREVFYCNLGDWLTKFTYLALDGEGPRFTNFAP